MTVMFRNIRLRRIGAKTGSTPKKKVVFIAGKPSHGFGAHEHNAGCLLLAKELTAAMPAIGTQVCRNGWPADPQALAGADAVVLYCDGGPGHPVIGHLQQISDLVAAGAGIGCIHYAVEVPKGDVGKRFLHWLGGYFETGWSVNPHWPARFETLPVHPLTRGVKPFTIADEWYYHMRFAASGVVPILTAVPPAETLRRPDGPHSGNPEVRAAVARGEPQHLAWVVERPDGGRGFGFTGGHFHWNWADPNFRRLVLNAIVWLARAEVPAGGVASQPVGVEQLMENLDTAPPADFDREALRKRLAKVAQ